MVSSLLVNGILILICLIWIVPTLGVFVTSFRDSQDIFSTAGGRFSRTRTMFKAVRSI